MLAARRMYISLEEVTPVCCRRSTITFKVGCTENDASVKTASNKISRKLAYVPHSTLGAPFGPDEVPRRRRRRCHRRHLPVVNALSPQSIAALFVQLSSVSLLVTRTSI